MPSKYTFTDYSPDWPDAFQKEASHLRSFIGDELIAIHHIGSTSVPGLPAKPIIDLIPVARDIMRIDECTPVLEAAGYKAWGEYGLDGRRFFTKDSGEYRTHNIHIYQDKHPDVDRHVAFREYLREHDEIRDEYADLKRRAYALHPADITAYNDAKNAWIRRTEKLAVDWFRSRKA